MKKIIFAFILGSITTLAVDYAAACWAKGYAIDPLKLVDPVEVIDSTAERLDTLEMRVLILELMRDSQECRPEFGDWHNKLDGEAVPL